MKQIEEPSRSIPVMVEIDVLVVGPVEALFLEG